MTSDIMHKDINSNRRTAMKRLLTVAALLAAGSLIAMQGAAADDAALIKSAESAAPAAVASGAAVYAMDEKGNMRTLREGKTGFWCMPDNPASPGPDPMCGDANSMEWAMAWLQKKEPPKGKVGFMYMLSGGTDGSNTDPYATKPEAGNNWIETGPHVMIVNAMDMMNGYPTDAKPDTSKPYVMWPGTPYAHLMIPVK
ncbi:hypothetical protein [Mesorhizobium sp. M1A.F.Ca.ET.072.01.1.1]|uniref:hypothetical protein n=2 Tax=unclassified Mesorhizobium TaxID=325217 RepID=UPI001FDFEF05|nr:hypothetical protein [Mesorhizobium sp. M1A.F.Ca.ET.072.01.1.1]